MATTPTARRTPTPTPTPLPRAAIRRPRVDARAVRPHRGRGGHGCPSWRLSLRSGVVRPNDADSLGRQVNHPGQNVKAAAFDTHSRRLRPEQVGDSTALCPSSTAIFAPPNRQHRQNPRPLRATATKMRPIQAHVKRLFHHFSAKTHSSAVQRELCVHPGPPRARNRPPLKRPSFRRALSSILHFRRSRPNPLGVRTLRYQTLPAARARSPHRRRWAKVSNTARSVLFQSAF